MFWSKIWFFLVAVVAGVTLTLALVMPRPAERATEVSETNRLARACVITEILLRDFAQSRIQLAGQTARVQGLDSVLLESSRGESVTGSTYSTAKKILTEDLNFGTTRKGDQEEPYRPDLILALDARGRVVARSSQGEDNLYGDSLRGYYLVDDALDGYLRDDLWIVGGKLYLVAAAPVITAHEPDWAGAVVIGEEVNKEFASELAEQLHVNLTFYAAGEAVAASHPAQLHEEMLARAQKQLKGPAGSDCKATASFSLSSGDESYQVLLARLPGEAGALGAFYSVYVPQEKAIGFTGTIKAVTKNDLSFSHFPWFRVAVVFLLMVGVGLALMIFEADQPLRRLSADLVILAKGESERLAEDRHRGKFGSIARSVNIALDKLHRETRAAKRDLDQLLGPMPGEDGAGSGVKPVGSPPPDLGAAFMPPPPPSEFRFTDGGLRLGGPTGSVAAAPSGLPGAGSLPGPGPLAGPASVGLPGASAPSPSQHGLGFEAGPRAAATDDRIPPPAVSLPPMTKRPIGTQTAGPNAGPAAGPASRPPIPRRLASPAGPPLPEASGIGPIRQDDFLGAPGSTGRTQQISIEDDEEDTVVAASQRGSIAALIRQSSGQGVPAEPDDGAQYRAIFDEFVALKRRCGESIDNLTYDRFLAKLRSNRDALIAKHGCRSVKFQVYVKDGKAALKASPVR
jgi:hypothetical protein